MRHMSFALTTKAFLEGRKTVTRRMGWKNLRPGDKLMAVEKGMGLRKGETITELGIIRIVSIRRERLKAITQEDVQREGFLPEVSRFDFIRMFCAHMGVKPGALVTRIEFEKIA